MTLKIDFHVHTCFSKDCTTTTQDIISYSRFNGVDGVAITDHDTIKGSSKLFHRMREDLIVVPGIEVTTNEGHLLGINIDKQIDPYLSVEETIEQIHEAGGISIAPHPTGFSKKGIGLDERFVSYGLDGIEVVNSTNMPFEFHNTKARRYAEKFSLPMTGGSDSHLPETIGLAYTIVEIDELNPGLDKIIDTLMRRKSFPFGIQIPWRLRLRKIIKKRTYTCF